MNTPRLFTFSVFSLIIFYITFTKGAFMATKIEPKSLWNATSTDKLRQDLLLNYDKFARPSHHLNTTTVRFGMEIKHVDVNEFKSTVTIVGWTKLVWTDDKLKWDENNYDGMGMIHVAPHEIWQPDIMLQNSATTTGLAIETVNLLLYNNGEVLWVPTTTFPILCDFNFETWPFDRQHCKLLVGSYTYQSDQIELQYYQPTDTIMNDRREGVVEWNITNLKYSTFYRDCYGSSCQMLEIDFTLERITNCYSTLILTPMFAVIILTLLSFWLPPKSGEKILLNVITIFIIVALMLYFTQKIPAMGTHTPLIVRFYTSSLIITTLCLIHAVLIISLTKTPRKHPLPWIIRNLLIGQFGKYLGLTNYIKQVNKPQENKKDIQTGKYQEEWILLAAAIDRISFIIYTIIFIILTSKYSV